MKLNADTLKTLHKRGHTDAEIANMTADKIFDEYCMWHGLIWWGPKLRRVYENAKKAQRSVAK